MNIIFDILMGFCLFLLIRNNLVYKIRSRMINYCFDHLYPDHRKVIYKYRYNVMIFMINKWTFKQFYPELIEINK